MQEWVRKPTIQKFPKQQSESKCKVKHGASVPIFFCKDVMKTAYQQSLLSTLCNRSNIVLIGCILIYSLIDTYSYIESVNWHYLEFRYLPKCQHTHIHTLKTTIYCYLIAVQLPHFRANNSSDNYYPTHETSLQ